MLEAPVSGRKSISIIYQYVFVYPSCLDMHLFFPLLLQIRTGVPPAISFLVKYRVMFHTEMWGTVTVHKWKFSGSKGNAANLQNPTLSSGD